MNRIVLHRIMGAVNKMHRYDIIIIGAGPAGLFASYYLLQNSNARILLVEKGPESQSRLCIHNCDDCTIRDRCSILCGIGGAGLFSDGKLVLDLNAGGLLDSVAKVEEGKKKAMISYIENTLRGFDGKSEEGPILSNKDALTWSGRFAEVGLNIKHYGVTHIGTQNLSNIITNFVSELRRYPNFDLRSNTQVINVFFDGEKNIVTTSDGNFFNADYIVFSVGKTGSSWMREIFERNNIEYRKTQTYLGIRLETRNEYLKELFTYSFDPKIWCFCDGHKIKTHCFCRHGSIICTNYMGFPIAGGHTKITNNNMPLENTSGLSSFNILASVDNSSEDILGVLSRFKLINSKGIVSQKLGTFLTKNDSKESSIRENLNLLSEIGDHIASFIIRLDKIIPGICSPDNTVYAPALEWFMDLVCVKPNMETTVKGWYAIGDGAGLSQGIIHSAATGLIAAEDLCLRLNDKHVAT